MLVEHLLPTMQVVVVGDALGGGVCQAIFEACGPPARNMGDRPPNTSTLPAAITAMLVPIIPVVLPPPPQAMPAPAYLPKHEPLFGHGGGPCFYVWGGWQ